MRIALFGSQDNVAYEFCAWLRALGHDAEAFSFDHDLPRSQPELIDRAVTPGCYPPWFHVVRAPLTPHVPMPGGRFYRMVEQRFDVLVVSGTRGLLASRPVGLPKVLFTLGGEVAEAPFAFAARWRGPFTALFRVLRAPVARAAIRRIDRIIENYDVNLEALDRLGLSARRVMLGWPEDVERNRSLVDPALDISLRARYRPCRRLFAWFTRLNFKVASDPAYKGCERWLAALEAVRPEITTGQVRLVIGTHGDDVAAFRALITQRGLAPFVDWVPHLPYPQLLTWLAQPNLVLFGKFGERLGMPASIDRDAWTMGTVLVSTVDRDYAERIYAARPPVLSATSVAEIAAACRDVVAMPDAAFSTMQQESLRFAQQALDYRAILPRLVSLLQQLRSRHDDLAVVR